MKIQPAEFINENRLLICGGQRYKIYLQAFNQKGKAQDIRKGNTLFRNDT